ncbi:MAG: FAD-dependent oxidoreductase [Oscillospiraceae bacterium]|nr:FAD-dependent oxidoreductase [Oscillospiraceae bacterium]
MAYVIDQAHCSCCHRCRVECPAGAIRFKGSKYWIDPEKCVSCGHCVTVCHNGVISNPDCPEPPVQPHERIGKSCDVLVIGGGAAGMAAAARAADSGKKVIVVEKNHEVGGSAWYAHMFRAQWSVWHEQEGIPDPREKLYRQFMKKTQNRVDGELVKNMLDADVDFVNWLITEHDLGKDYVFGDGPFNSKGLVSTYDEPYNHLRIDTAIGPGGNGWFLCLKLLKILEAKGGEVLYKTAGKHLLTDETGAVVGAICEDAGGEIEIRAKATIVTAGAFTHNKELMNKFQPIFYRDDDSEPVHVFTCATCTGDGITMCDEIGADIDYVNRRVNLFGPARHPFGTCGLSASRGMSTMNVDPSGKIFNAPMAMTEVSPLAHTKERYLWCVIDQTGLENAMESSKGRTPDAVGVDMDRLYNNFQAEIDEEVEWGSIKKADTLEGLADALGVDREVFLASVREHNAHLNDPMPFGPPPGGDEEGPGGPPPAGPGGPDEDADDGPMFGPMDMPAPTPLENGPFYALLIKLFHENAVGGMATDGRVRVLKQGKPIPGLYAAGDNIRGIMLPGEIGVQYIEGVLSALTSAFCGGYLAGEEAVKYVD